PVMSPTELSTRSLHDALPISHRQQAEVREATSRGSAGARHVRCVKPRLFDQSGTDAVVGARHDEQARSRKLLAQLRPGGCGRKTDRKSTRLNSSHVKISYAVF